MYQHGSLVLSLFCCAKAAMKRTDDSLKLWQRHHACHTKKCIQETSVYRYEKRYERFDLTANDNVCGESAVNLEIGYTKNRRKASEEIPTHEAEPPCYTQKRAFFNTLR
jgi:hypothetical protein